MEVDGQDMHLSRVAVSETLTEQVKPLDTKHCKTIHLIAAARPNFVKIAPLYHALFAEEWVQPVIIHTGQHFDVNMSDDFFNDLDLPAPDVHLGVRGVTHAEQTGMIMMAYERIIRDDPPDLVIVVGDVNSTMACTLAAVKLGIRVAHLEAGLRSFDRTMPEEINRIVTDSLADILWTPSADADEHLKREGIAHDKIYMVGNIMIDSLVMMEDAIGKDETWKKLGLVPNEYGVVTLHRPSTVDNHDRLKVVYEALVRVSRRIPLVFPVHPRTAKRLTQFDLTSLLDTAPAVTCLDPLSYVSFMNLLFSCGMVVTDSGGLQEETTYLGIPCLTLRRNTERPITIEQGTNRLCEVEDLEIEVSNVLNTVNVKVAAPDMWDGQTATRITAFLKSYLRS